MSASVTFTPFWRAVLMDLLQEAGQGGMTRGQWIAFTGAVAGVLVEHPGAPTPLLATLDQLLEYGVSVVNALGIERVAELGDRGVAELRGVAAAEVATLQGKSPPESA